MGAINPNANGLKSATTIVNVSAATAPSSGQVLTATSSTAATWQAAGGSSVLTLLTTSAGSGTSTNVLANNLATCSISGLTALDQLEIRITLDAATAGTGTAQLYSSTDSLTIMDLMAGGSSLTVNSDYHGTANLMPNQRDNKTYLTNIVEVGGAAPTGGGQTGSSTSRYGSYALSTAWTGSWTLALRSGGVSATGSLKWSWVVYKRAGQ